MDEAYRQFPKLVKYIQRTTNSVAVKYLGIEVKPSQIYFVDRDPRMDPSDIRIEFYYPSASFKFSPSSRKCAAQELISDTFNQLEQLPGGLKTVACSVIPCSPETETLLITNMGFVK
jgi:hypothetical protein